MFDFAERPGLLFVWATLLPLAAFTVLLIMGAVRNLARRYKAENATAASVFHALGGYQPGKAAFWIATGAIGLACVLSVTGFVLFLKDSHHAHGHSHHSEHKSVTQLEGELATLTYKRSLLTGENKADKENRDKIDLKIADVKSQIAHQKERWSGSVVWAQVLPRFYEDNNPDHGTTLRVGFYIDGLAAIMFVMVTFVATLIHIFACGYMSEELNTTVEDHEVHTAGGHLKRRGRFGRFYLFMALFCFSMLNLVLADNLFQVFVSWELVGVCSYLLIGYYYERQSASNAANKAFITNRVGDAGFIIGLIIVWTYIGTFNFQEIFARVRAPDSVYVGDEVQETARKVELDRNDKHRILYGSVEGEIPKLRPVPVPGEENKFELKDDGILGEQVQVFPHDKPPTWDARVLLFPRNLPENVGVPVIAAPSTTRGIDTYHQPAKNQFGSMPYWMLVAAGLGIFLGCVGKSAQFPLQVWLPDAMEGPTPVSALIHAATMVAAGVYLVGRCFPLFTAEVLLAIAYTGAITLFVAATIAIVATDIKKVLAYSTVSQLGYMMLGLGVGGWVAGLFHLITHAFFKALMFLASGSVIYGCHHVQEMTRMGGLCRKMKITALTMLMGVLAISGIPLFSGWYSKDAILASAFGFADANPMHYLLFLAPLATAGITTFYMFRMWFMTFAGPPRDQHVYDHAHETSRVMTTPLIILAVFSVCVAWGWPVWNAEASWLEHQLHHSLPPSASVDAGTNAGVLVDFADAYHRGHEAHAFAGNLALLMVLLGFTFAALLYWKRVLDPADAVAQFPGVYTFLSNKWYFDELYSAILVRPSLRVAGWCRSFDMRVIDGLVNWLGRANVGLSRASGRFDRGVVDGLVNLLANVWYGIGNGLRGLQTGYLRSYVLFLVLAAIGIWVLVSLFVGAPASGAP